MQMDKPDDQLSARERELEERLKATGIPARQYVVDEHDCDDFAFRAYHRLRSQYEGQLGVKWYKYNEADGTEVGHALVFIDWPNGTRTYIEPQSGEVVTLPEPRVQTFESKDPEEINQKHHEVKTIEVRRWLESMCR